MTQAKVSYNINPRFVPDDIPVWFGNVKDAAVIFDNANDELTLQTKNAAGALIDRLAIKANTATPTVIWNETGVDLDYRIEALSNAYAFFLDGATGYLLLGKNTVIAPDNMLHIWKSNAGAVAADADSILVLENNGEVFISFLCSTLNSSGLRFGQASDNNNAQFRYSHEFDRFEIQIVAVDRLYYSAAAFAFQETTVVSTANRGAAAVAGYDLNVDAGDGGTGTTGGRGGNAQVSGGDAKGTGDNPGGRAAIKTGAATGTGLKPLVELDAAGGVPTTSVLAAGHVGFKYNAAGTLVAYVNDGGAIKSLSLGTPA